VLEGGRHLGRMKEEGRRMKPETLFFST
jgi:hypothetical protein